MKNFTNNFKQFTSRLSARWLIMALMLLVGTSSAWAGKLYLKPNDNWINNTNRYSAYFFGNGETWVSMEAGPEDKMYYCEAPAGYPKVIFCAMNKNNTTNDWNNKWNQTGDLTIPTDGKNLFTISGTDWDGFTTTWSTYTPPCNITLSVSKDPNANIYLTSESVTLTATATNQTSITWKKGDTTLDTGNSYTYTQSEVGSASIKAIAENATCSAEKEVTLSFVNQKKIVVKCKGTTGIYLYTWNGTNNDGTTTWPGATTSTIDGEYYVWEILTDAPINIQFNKGSNNPQTKDINGLQVGYEYVFTWNGNHDASIDLPSPTELPKPCTPVQASHYTISQTEYTYDGTAKKPTVEAETGAGTPTSIVYKQGDNEVTDPINVGIYDVYVTSDNGATYCGASNLKVDSFEIICTEDITKDNFSYTLPTDAKYTGNQHEVSVNWESGTTQTNGVITVYYKQGSGEYTNQAPTLEGTYTVAAKVTTAGNYCESDYIELGEFDIELAEQEDFSISTDISVCGATTTLSATGGSGEGSITYEIGATNTANASIVNSTTLMATKSGSVEITATKAGEEGKYLPTSSTVTIEFTIPVSPFAGDPQSTTICAGSPFNYEAAYNWYTSESGNQTVSGSATLDATTEYYISQTINGCESARTEYTVNVDAKPKVVLTTNEEESICQGDEINLEGYIEEHSGTIKWYSDSEYNTEITELTFTPNTQTYYVKATNGVCEPATASLSIKVIAKPTIPTLDTVDPRCDSYTLPTEDKNRLPIKWYETMESVTPLSDNTTVTATGTYYAEGVNGNCVSDSRTELEVTINATPTITASAAVTQPNVALTLNSAAGDATEWEVSTNPNEAGSITNSTGASVNFIATEIGEYVVTATNGDCSFNFTINVADAFYVYMRQPKKGENAYNNFYYPTENPTQGGDLFYKEYASIPPAEGYTDYNTGGVAHDIIFTDCDGYVWYGFKASDKLVDGTNYFTVHAPNLGGIGGYYTHTYLTKPGAMISDIYYTMDEDASNSSQGWYITEVSAPYLGPVVRSLGSTTLDTDKFAALYVTDCSGKEIDAYQWEYCSPEGDTYDEYEASVSNSGTLYSGDAGRTNNIRPSVAGFYRCTVEYKGGGTATSAAVEIDGTYNRSFTSTIPVLVVNTGNKDFPGCQASGTDNYPSKYADELKAKRSVDVKIYDGEGALVYDRKARMAYRGSSSLNFTKKSYAFCPGKANCGDEDKGADYVKTEKLNMLGVGDAVDKDWVLYAAAADPSLMRNRMVFDTYQAMRNDWGVHSRYVELIVNGDYKGVYVFMDKITMNENRVEVDEDKGFIVKFDKTDCADRVEGYNGIFGDQKTFSTERTGRYGISTYHTTVDQLFEIEYPEKDDYPTGWANKVASIKEMFQAFEDALEAGDYATVQKYIDYDSWADWFIINEFTKNLDAYRASCIFVYTGEAGSKIEARPLWDQELSFNNAAANISGKGANSTSGLLIQNDGVYTDCFPAPFWFTGQLATFGTCGVNNGSGEKGDKLANCLLNDPCFVQVVKEKWNQHQFDALSAEKLNALVTKYTNELGDAALERESNQWPNNFRTSADCSAGSTGYNEVSHLDSKTAITSWIADGANGRREGLTTAINGLTGASFSIQIVPSEVTTTPWEPVEIAVSVTPDGYDYKLEYTDNDLGSVANTIIKEEGDKITYRIPRPWPAGDEQQEGERTDIEYGIKATLNVQDGTTVCGSQAAPSSTGKIILQDEPNDNCK